MLVFSPVSQSSWHQAHKGKQHWRQRVAADTLWHVSPGRDGPLIFHLSLPLSERLLKWPFLGRHICNFHDTAVFSTFWNAYPPRPVSAAILVSLLYSFRATLLRAFVSTELGTFKAARWWKCFCRKKVTCSDRLWIYHVIMLQSRLTLFRKWQWPGFGLLIMWPQRFGTLTFHIKTFVCLCVCASTSLLHLLVIKSNISQQSQKEAFPS